MKSCAGFAMRSVQRGPNPASRASVPKRRRLSMHASRCASVHSQHPTAWDASSVFQDAVVWTETTPVRASVELLERVGEGTYGAVYRGLDSATGECVAVKKIPTRGNGLPGSSVEPFKIALEADIHGAVDDVPEIATLQSHVRMDDAECLVMEFCSGGDLEQFSMQHGPLDASQIAEIARQTLSVVKTCHDQGILHGDIKAANFVIHSKNDVQKLTHAPEALETGWLKAIDFGCSMRMGKGKCTRAVGTPTHWPPEVFASKFGLAADLWSLGTMLYLLATHRMPYFTPEEHARFRTERDILLKIITSEIDFERPELADFSDAAKDFLRRLLTREETKRMTAAEALAHPFLRNPAEAATKSHKQRQKCRQRDRRRN